MICITNKCMQGQRACPTPSKCGGALRLSDPEAAEDVAALQKELQDPQKADAFLRKAGIIAASGQLAQEYGGPPESAIRADRLHRITPPEDIGYEAPVPSSYLPRDREMKVTMHEPEGFFPPWAGYGAFVAAALLAIVAYWVLL